MGPFAPQSRTSVSVLGEGIYTASPARADMMQMQMQQPQPQHQQQQQPAVTAVADNKFCSNCGGKVHGTFCSGCGTQQ